MFIGWIRKKSFTTDLVAFNSQIIIDKSLVLKTFDDNNSLCFGAYDENKLVAFISAYEMEQSILINNFYYLHDISKDIKKRLVKLLLDNINEDEKPILFMSNRNEKDIFTSFKFKEYTKFKKAVYGGEAVAFNFTNATSKSITNDNYLPVMTSMDKRAYNENRVEYTKHALLKESSLILSTQFGYQHSYSIGKSLVKISPWVMEDAAFSDAEKMIRGVIYHRGLKRIFAFIPSDIKEITDLYKSYKFDLSDEYILFYKNTKPSIDLEMIYAF